MTLCARGKLGKWWKNTLTYRFLRLLWRGLRAIWRGTVAAVRAIPMVWRTLLVSTGLAFLIAILLGNHAGGAYTQMCIRDRCTSVTSGRRSRSTPPTPAI